MSRLPLALTYAGVWAALAGGAAAGLDLQPAVAAAAGAGLGLYLAVEDMDRMERSLREERTDVEEGRRTGDGA